MSDIIAAKDLRPGNTFLFKDGLFQVIENSFNKTAMREGIVKCKVKNLRNGSITIEVLTGEKLEKAQVDTMKMTYSYDDGANCVFMDNSTYETIEIPQSRLTWEKQFITEGSEVSIQKYNDEILGVSLPDQIVAVVSDAEEGVQGNTVQAAQKKAWISTGLEIQVPQFIKTGDKVLINTTTGEYVGRTH
ncbi:MAG: elongation factor P [Mycoplasmataceae bacterium]|nr:elongation factor P [Mycoplasmataceae bacterium]